MKCLRCQFLMKQYPVNMDFGIWGKWHSPGGNQAEAQLSHNPQSVYICEKCGYVEFNMNECSEYNI